MRNRLEALEKCIAVSSKSVNFGILTCDRASFGQLRENQSTSQFWTMLRQEDLDFGQIAVLFRLFRLHQYADELSINRGEQLFAVASGAVHYLQVHAQTNKRTVNWVVRLAR